MTSFFRRGHPTTEELSRSLDGMLKGRALTGSQRHLAGCSGCRERISALLRVRTRLQALAPIELSPLSQLQPPLFIPVAGAPLGAWAVAGGIMAGMGLVGILLFRPVSEPMRVVSNSSSSGIASEGLSQSEQLQSGSPLKNMAAGDVDLEVSNQVLFRLKPGATVTWQEIRRPWIFGGRPHIVLNVMSGEVLARTRDSFWGSRLQVRTPRASATVKGTAFSVKVEPSQDATTLKVLAGEVFFSPYLGRVGVNVQSGKSSRMLGDSLMPQAPEAMSAKERRALLETYQIGVDPQIALVIGGGPERTDELLRPALLYVSTQAHPQFHPYMRKLVREINQAILEGELPSAAKSVRLLEGALKDVTDPALAVPLRLFVGACSSALGQPLRAQVHFRKAEEAAPAHPLASVAQAAIARLAEGPLHDPELARSMFSKILSKHPHSPEADLARRFIGP